MAHEVSNKLRLSILLVAQRNNHSKNPGIIWANRDTTNEGNTRSSKKWM